MLVARAFTTLALFSVLLSSGFADGQVGETPRRQDWVFVDYADITDFPAWPMPAKFRVWDRKCAPSWAVKRDLDLVWVITADAFAWHLAYGYWLLNEDAMRCLPPLLRATLEDFEASLKDRPPKGEPDLDRVITYLRQLVRISTVSNPDEAIEYGEPFPEDVAIMRLRQALGKHSWSEPPFDFDRMSVVTAHAWCRYEDLIRKLYGSPEVGFPGWLLRAARARLGQSVRPNGLTVSAGGLVPRVGDFLAFDGWPVNKIPRWARQSGFGLGGVLTSPSCTRAAVARLCRRGAADPTGISFRKRIWMVLAAMEREAPEAVQFESEELSLPGLCEYAERIWSQVRTESLLGTAAVTRFTTQQSPVFGAWAGKSGGFPRVPRHFILYAVPPETWKALEAAGQAMVAARRALQAARPTDQGRHEDQDIEPGKASISEPWEALILEQIQTLQPLAQARGSSARPLLIEVTRSERWKPVVESLSSIKFEDECLPWDVTTLADAGNQATRTVLRKSWLYERFEVPRVKRFILRLQLNGRPMVGIGAAPTVRVKKRGDDLVRLAEIWGR